MKSIVFGFLLGLAAITFACGNDAEKADKQETETTTSTSDAKQGKEYTSAYICPMHCKGSGSAEPGKCPECKMAYVANEKQSGETHDHDHNHDHGSHDGHNH
ncbi:MAG: hypothetical protein MRY78_21255 [Saprospiraceae bacterium]|nr:hypothetical protein [Saprospiraceae bacterium]